LFIKPLKQLRYETCCNLNFIIPAIQKEEKKIGAAPEKVSKRKTSDFPCNFEMDEVNSSDEEDSVDLARE
jgi:hypothetical protein